MKNWLTDIIHQHLLPLLAYIAAYIAPAGPFILVMEMVILSDHCLSWLMFKQRKLTERPSALQMIIKMAIFSWLILMLLVIEDFMLNKVNVLSNIMAGYITWIYVRKIIQNIDIYTNTNLWNKIEDTINKLIKIK